MTPDYNRTFRRTPTAEHVLWKAREIVEAEARGEPQDGLRLSWARMILAANTPNKTLGAAREGKDVPSREIYAALKSTGDVS
jgi:hypothetical protein